MEYDGGFPDGYMEFDKTKWKKKFAWRPRKIGEKWFWLTEIYVRYAYYQDSVQGVEYGTILDVLKEPNNET